MTTPYTIRLATTYLPPLPVFAQIAKASEILIDTGENYPKQTLRNRTHIMSANGIQCLTVPVLKKNSLIQPVKDMKIDYSTNWQRIHWQSMVSAYGKSPFFMYYDYLLEPFYSKKTLFLIDFNTGLLNVLLNSILKKNGNIMLNENFQQTDENILDLRYLCDVKSYTGIGDTFQKQPYYQVFASKHGFISGLSIADLLFNTGPDAGTYLKGLNGTIID